jgi:hypothetical protein
LALGGKMVKLTYTLGFSGGPNKSIVFTVLQPNMTGGYHIMDTEINNPSAAASMQTQ